MKSAKATLKKILVKEHREWMYGQALDNLLLGVESPEYCHLRWLKLKQVREKK